MFFFDAVGFKNDDSREKFKDYLQQSAAIASEYGGEYLTLFTPVENLEGEFEVDLFGYTIWNNFSSLMAYLKDPRINKLRKLREDGVQNVFQLIAQHSPDFPFADAVDAFPPDDATYLFNAMWFNDDGGLELFRDVYLPQSFTVAQQYGAMPLAPNKPVMTRRFNPDLLAIVRWPNDLAFDTYLADPDFIEISPIRKNALDKALLIRSRVAHEFMQAITD